MKPASSVAWRDLNRESLWQGRRPVLEHLDLELTERCNNACIHCCISLSEDDAQAKARELSTEAWQDILDQAAAMGALSVRFTGGEPLLRDDFAELYLYARRLGLQVVIFTNARLITPQLADLWVRIPPRRLIEVTVYGMRAMSYEAVSCSPGSFSEYHRGIQLLLDRGVPFVVKGALLPPNIDELPELDAWARTIPWMQEPPSLALYLDLRNRRDSASRNRLIASLRLSPEQGLAALARRGDDYRNTLRSFCAQHASAPGNRLFTCGAGQSPCVDAYGRLQPCMGVRSPDLAYDLLEIPLRDALTHLSPRLARLCATNPDYLARCARCFLKDLCNQCPAKSWSETGTLDTPVEYHCQVAHAKARALGLLADNEKAWNVADIDGRINQMMNGVD